MILGTRNSGARMVVRIHVLVLPLVAGPEDFWDLAAVRRQLDPGDGVGGTVEGIG